MKTRVVASELLAATKIASKCKEHEDDRYALLRAVRVWCDGYGKYTIVATDSIRLVEFKGIDTHWGKEAGEVVIDAEFIKKNVKASDNTVDIESDGNNVNIEIRNKKGAVRYAETVAVEDKYPDYKKLWIEPNDVVTNSICVNATLMQEMCDMIATAYGKNIGITVTFVNVNKPIIIEAKNDDEGSCKAIIMPIKQ